VRSQPIWAVERRTHEEHLSARISAARPPDADDLGHSLQLSIPEPLWPAIAQIQGTRRHCAFRDAYFGLIRFRRHSWLLIYLFGASPSLCKSFVKEQTAQPGEFR
jgi:hypothetical protein